jgi:hypothetical protein
MHAVRSTTHDRRWLRHVWMVVFALLVVLTVLFLLELLLGGVGGTEFAPDRFERRAFYFHQIPWVQLQVTPVQRHDTTNDLEHHLRRQRLIAPGPPRRWDLVTVYAGAGLTQGQAQILCRYLDQRNAEGKLRWLEWTNQQPELALPFWAAVQQAAQLEAYCLVPELFALAEHPPGESGAFRQQLDQLLARLYGELGDDYRAVEQPALAARCYAAALERNRDDLALRQKQAQVLRSLDTAPQPDVEHDQPR